MNKFLKFMLIMLLPIWLVAKNDDYEQVAAQIKESLQKVITEYRAGNIEQAVSDTQNAYFGLFEDVEAGIRINLGQKKAYSMEKQFGEIRKAIKAGEAPDDVQKRIDQINSEIAEVLPVILKGHRLVGEYSDSPAQAATTDYDTSKFIPEWKVAFTNLSADIDKAIASYESDKQDDAKSAIQDAKFTDYRNTQLEIAIRQHIENGKSIDADIQRKMGEAISGITNGISKDDFKTKLDEIKKLAYEAISKLPADTAKLAKVDMSDVEAASEEDSGADYAKVVQNINDKIQAAITLYKNGDAKKAMGDIQDIYFDEFEGSGMENKVGAIDVNLKTAIEATFGNLVALMKSGADEKTLQESASKM